MDQERRSIRLGLAVIACAAVFRLLGGGILDSAAQFIGQADVLSFLLYLETGRVVRTDAPVEPDLPVPEETVPQQTLPQVQPQPLTLPAVESGFFTLRNHTSYHPDMEALYSEDLQWELIRDEPTVLILHTHATESYTQTVRDTYTESSDYRTLDEDRNMISVGTYVAQLLEQGGIHVLHDTTLHDYPEYTGSYGRARDTIESYLEQYPSIQLILDLHRDAADDGEGGQMDTSATVDGQSAAQLMLVVGTGQGGLSHPSWQQNLSVAVKLQAVLETNAPGLCRSISLRTERFNQDLLPGALLVEVGAAGDTRQEALNAGKALAEGILQLAHGAVTKDSAN